MLCQQMTMIMRKGVASILAEEEFMALCDYHGKTCRGCRRQQKSFKLVPPGFCGPDLNDVLADRNRLMLQLGLESRARRDALLVSARSKYVFPTEPNVESFMCSEMHLILQHGISEDTTFDELNALFDYHWVSRTCSKCDLYLFARYTHGRSPREWLSLTRKKALEWRRFPVQLRRSAQTKLGESKT